MSNILRQYNILALNHKISNSRDQNSHFLNIKTANTICKNLYQWKQFDLLEKLFQIDSRTYLYFLKRLLVLKNTKQFLSWFNKYNINWNTQQEGLKYLTYQLIKYNHYKLFSYFQEKYHVDKFEKKFYVNVILHTPNCYYNDVVTKIIETLLSKDDIPKPYNEFSMHNLYVMLHYDLEDTIDRRCVYLASRILEKQKFNELASIFNAYAH